jgi:UDP-N-acetylmuramoyl-L-alanyl-D-glutamate--2,6-diaminopimelate ligase
MKLKKILKNISCIEIKGSKDIDITGVCCDSKLVFPGNLFIAISGTNYDGAKFIPEAISAGAVAVVTDMYDPFIDKSITQVIHDDVRAIQSSIAETYYDSPSKNLMMIGVSGTNGKTTTSYLIKHILESVSYSTGLIGTVEYIVGPIRHFASITTPDSITNQKLLREMVNNDCKAAVMEVTSHGIDQGRIKNIDFDIKVFTNLTQDHLDYHSTFENYASTKKQFFDDAATSKKKLVAVINKDSDYSDYMSKDINYKIMSYGITTKADVVAEIIDYSINGTSFYVTYNGEKEKVISPLIGDFNIYNILAAIAVGISIGLTLKVLAKSLAKFPQIPGRMERVKTKSNKHIFIDFAHTEDALENTLTMLNKIKKGRIISIFGCGGQRDNDKRPKMARVCEKLSDLCIVTNDNPRKEDPEDICRQIIKGFDCNDSYRVELNRYKAIKLGIDYARDDDIVLIAGKGHEETQIFANRTDEFNDKKVVIEVCNKD